VQYRVCTNMRERNVLDRNALAMASGLHPLEAW